MSAIAERSGVSRSQLYRIDAGVSSPSLETLREIAIATGLDVEIDFVPLSDPYVAIAARLMLGEQLTESEEASRWVERLARNALETTTAICAYAGSASNPRHRRGTAAFRGKFSPLTLVDAASAANGQWAASGALALNALTESSPALGPTILWVQEVELVAQVLSLSMRRRDEASSIADVIVAKAPEILFANGVEQNGLHLVSPLQAIIDGFGLGGALRDRSLELTEGD